jgi:hypothetical protein
MILNGSRVKVTLTDVAADRRLPLSLDKETEQLLAEESPALLEMMSE